VHSCSCSCSYLAAFPRPSHHLSKGAPAGEMRNFLGKSPRVMGSPLSSAICSGHGLLEPKAQVPSGLAVFNLFILFGLPLWCYVLCVSPYPVLVLALIILIA
jgi:hypothetical protein